MFRKSLLALATLATVTAAALAPTAASAKPFKGGGYHHHHGYAWGIGAGLVGAALVADAAYSNCWVKTWVDTPFGPRLRSVNVCY